MWVLLGSIDILLFGGCSGSLRKNAAAPGAVKWLFHSGGVQKAGCQALAVTFVHPLFGFYSASLTHKKR